MNAEQLQQMLRVQGELATIEVLHRENDRYREALEDATEYLRLASTWIDDTDRHLKMRRACERACEALDVQSGGASAPAPPAAQSPRKADS